MSAIQPKSVTVTANVNHPSFLDFFKVFYSIWLAAEPSVMTFVHDENAQAGITIATGLAPVVAGAIVAAGGLGTASPVLPVMTGIPNATDSH